MFAWARQCMAPLHLVGVTRSGCGPPPSSEHDPQVRARLPGPGMQATVAQLRAPVPKLVAIRESRLKKVNGC